MNWSTKRKFIYGLLVFVLSMTVVVFLLRNVLFSDPTCFDTKQNGFETGLDCGGACSLRCVEEVSAPVVLWSKAVKISHNTYDVVALISNKNINNASHALGYVFTLYNEQRISIATLNGTTTAPIDGDFPVIIQNVLLRDDPAEVSLQLYDTPHFKVEEKIKSPVKILNRRFENGTLPRVYTRIQNLEQKPISNLPVRVILFDSKDNVYAVGESVVPFLDREAVEDVVITWEEPLLYVPTRIGVYPILDPFISFK